MRAFGPAISSHFWDDNRFPAYTYDKISIGLIDAHQFAADPQALKVLDAAAEPSNSSPAAEGSVARRTRPTKTSPSAGTSHTHCRRISSAMRGEGGTKNITRTSLSDSLPTIGIGIRLHRDTMCSPESTPTAT